MRSDKTDLNDPAFDRLLDIMLDEASGHAVPPDVSSHVLGILDADEHPVAWMPSIQTGPAAPRRRLSVMPVITVASLLVALGTLIWYHTQTSDQQARSSTPSPNHDAASNQDAAPIQASNHQTASTANSTVKSSADPNQPSTSGGEAATSPGQTQQQRPKSQPWDVAIEVPFGTDKPWRLNSENDDKGDAGSAANTTVAANASPPADPLPADEIITQLNDLLSQAWTRLGVTPRAAASADELAERLGNRLGNPEQHKNRYRSAAEFLLADELDKANQQMAIDASTSHELGMRWARRMLGRYGWNRLNKQQQAAAGEFFSKCFTGETRYDRAVQALLTTQGASSSEDEDFAPATIWMAGLAGSRSIPLTDQFCNVILDLDVACARCHAHPLTGDMPQQDYWSLNAVFETAVQWELNRSGRLRLVNRPSSDRSHNVVFFESPDGRQQVAAPALNTQWLSQTRPRSAQAIGNTHDLAVLLGNGERLAHAAVNELWNMIYGHRLVGRISDPLAPPTDPGFSAACDLLAEQLQAHQYDLGSATRWILSSRPLQLQSGCSLSDKESLVLTQQQLQQAEIECRSFAAYSNQGSDWSFTQLVALAERFNGRIGDQLKSSPDTLLAQPVEGSLASNGVAKSSAQQRVDALRRSFPAATAELALPAGWIQSIAASSGFEQQVHHLYYVAGYWQPTKAQLDAAQRLRKSAGNDSAALNQLWWAINLSNQR